MSVIVFDRNGNQIADIPANTIRTWVLNSEGDCKFSLGTGDPQTLENVLQFGNLILVEHDFLPDWVGVIDLGPDSRNWGQGQLSVTAYSAERLLSYGFTPEETVSGTAGKIFKRLLSLYNQEALYPIQLGNIWMGGDERQEKLGDTCYEQVCTLADNVGNDWYISHQLVNGRLKLYANWYQRRGTDTGLLISETSSESVSPRLQEYGPIYNIITAQANASTPGKRLSVTVREEKSIRLFGPRRMKVSINAPDKASLRQSARAYLAESAWPTKVLPISVTDEGAQSTIADALNPIKNLGIGNSYLVSLNTVGFRNGGVGVEATMRLAGMRYSDENVHRVELSMQRWEA